MGGDNTIGAGISAAEAASLLGWWLEAGVDVSVQETPRDWLKAKAPAPDKPPEKPAAQMEELPESLAAFQDWLASSPYVPLAAAASRRVMPHGTEAAAVMLIADAPAHEDAAAGQPIGGPAWDLTVRMLAAIGLKAEDAYLASLSCAYAPGSKLSGPELEACAALTRRHIVLARPKRLLLLGDGPCRALLGKQTAVARGHVHRIEGVRTVATFHPRLLLNQPSNKALAWRDLLLLMEDEG